MTKAQYKRFNKLNKKLRANLSVVEISESSVTFYAPFPKLYLTYDRVGTLLQAETEAERKIGSRPLKGAPVLTGEMGSDTRGLFNNLITDDDIPF